MSAAVAWDLAPAPARIPARPGRPQLRLVPTGDAVVAPARRPLRLNRRGRLALTLLVAFTVAAFALVLFSGGEAGSVMPAIDHATTVSAGQTLSEIAARQLPQLPVSDGVARIQLANNLSTLDVHAGQTLLIPRVG